MSVPNTFASATSAIPLANLDADFAYYDAAFQIVGTAMEVNYTFRLEDPTDTTKKAEFVMSGITTGTTRQYTMPNASGTLATLANTSQTFLGSTTFAPTTNSGTVTIGGIPQTGTVTLGRSTASQTVDIAVGATTAVSTKTVNIGTTGVSGSTTNINFGSAVSGALVTQTWNAGANSMRFDSSGNLGIGTTSPQSRLHVSGTGNAEGIIDAPGGTSILSLVGTAAAGGLIAYKGATLRIGSATGYGAAGFVDQIRLDSAGNVGIGTTLASSYSMKLAVVNNIGLIPTSQNVVGSNVSFKSQLGSGGGETFITNQITGYSNAANYDTAIAFSTRAGTTVAERMRLDASGNLLVGATTAGSMSGNGVIGVGVRGGIIANSAESVANNGTLDIAVSTTGGGYQGFLIITNTVTSNANVRTHTTYSAFGRGTDSSFQQIASDNGTTGGAAFTVTTPTNGVIRVTNTSGNTTAIAIQFFGGTSH